MYLYIYIILYQFVAILRVTFPIDSQGHKSRVDNVCQSRVGINAVTCNDWCSILAPKKRRKWSSSPGSRLLLQRSHFVNPLLLLPSPWPQRKTGHLQPGSTMNREPQWIADPDKHRCVAFTMDLGHHTLVKRVQ